MLRASRTFSKRRAEQRSAFRRSARRRTFLDAGLSPQSGSRGTFFFTVNFLGRRSNLLVANIHALRDAVRRVRARAPFHIDAWVVLPDHMHCVDIAARRCRFSGSVASDQDRIREIAADRRAAITGHDTPRRTRHLAAAVLGAHDPRRSRLTWTIRISARSSMVSWCTRRTGRIRHFPGALPAGCIPPTGGAAAINRDRLANGSETEAAEVGRATRLSH
jgi:hypothetical protein